MFYICSRQGSGHTRLMETTQAEATMQRTVTSAADRVKSGQSNNKT